MSYNYDINPWDDNYNANTSQNAQTGYAGYINPMAQYSNTDEPYQQNQQYQYQDEQQRQDIASNDRTQQGEEFQREQLHESWLCKFLRQYCRCFNIFGYKKEWMKTDTLSGVNLPLIDKLVQCVNRDLLVSKMFYFFFYSAFGSLFPLMGVYFKQLGMNPAQVGILTGVRPFIEIFSAPFWNSLAERFHKSKALLLFSVLSWIVFTYSLAHIRPPASACVAFNDTYYVLYTPYSANDLSNYDVGQLEESEPGSSREENEMFMNKISSKFEGATGLKDRKSKDEILASEENQNDQGRKRRKREVSNGGINQQETNKNYIYTIEDDRKDDSYGSHLDLDVDLENDFDDKLISQDNKLKNNDLQNHEPSFFESENGNENSPEYDELEQLYSKGSRFKRSVSMKKVNNLIGEGDETNEVDELESKEEGKVKERLKEREREEAEAEEEDEDEKYEESEGSSNNNNNNKKKDRGTVKYNQLPVGTTGSTTMSTLAELPYDSSVSSREIGNVVNKTKRVYKQRHKTPPTHIVGMSPITVEYAVNYNKEKHNQFVTPMFSTIVYKLDDIKEVFFLLLLLISLGEFFSAPALTLADSATLSYLGDNTDLYGRQRMFGSLSWAITLLLVGMALDNATSIADHPCGPHQRERSYTVCFIIFSLLMACAFLTATQFRFNYPKNVSGGNQILMASTTNENGSTVVTTIADGSSVTGTGNIDEFYASTQPRSIFNTAPPVNAPPPNGQQGGKEKFEFLDKWKSAVFAQRTGELPEWVNVFRQFRNSLHLTYLFITWFLGCGVGLVFTFLFWHLQDIGGTPTLFGICSVINHISEILAYFFSFSFIKRFGHTRVLSVGLGCNVIRFLYVAFLTDPYYALPFELVQGITHAACFAACCSYISHVSKPELRTSTQGVMQGLHHGIGRACGALLGGYMINAIGSRASFCIYGLLSGCVLAGFLYVRKRVSQLEDEEVKVDDSEALGGYGAPQGVPSAIPGKIAQTASTQDIDYQW